MPPRTPVGTLKRNIKKQVYYIHKTIKKILDLGGTAQQIAELDEPLRVWEEGRLQGEDKDVTKGSGVDQATTSQKGFP